MVYLRARLSSAFLHGLQLGMRNSPPQIDILSFNLTVAYSSNRCSKDKGERRLGYIRGMRGQEQDMRSLAL